MKQLSIMLAGFLVAGSFAVIAADLPTAIEGEEAFNQLECINQNTDDCVQSVCMNSPELDCTDQCKTDAENKCKALSE